MSPGRECPAGSRIPAEDQRRLESSKETVHHSYYHGRRVVHHLLHGQITFVPYEQFVDVLARVALDLLQPLLHVVERLLVRAIVHYDDAVRAPVIRRRDRTESLLASGVPLQGEGELD